MFHVCVQRFDGMDEKILGGKLNRALDSKSKLFEVINNFRLYNRVCIVSALRCSHNFNLFLELSA